VNGRSNLGDALARPRTSPGIPRLALSKTEAAEAIGVSVDFFDEHVAGDLRIVRKGRRRLILEGLEEVGLLVPGGKVEERAEKIAQERLTAPKPSTD
jgi:hypothetical protein